MCTEGKRDKTVKKYQGKRIGSAHTHLPGPLVGSGVVLGTTSKLRVGEDEGEGETTGVVGLEMSPNKERLM